MLKSVGLYALYMVTVAVGYGVVKGALTDAPTELNPDFIVTMAVTGALGGYWDWRRQRRRGHAVAP